MEKWMCPYCGKLNEGKLEELELCEFCQNEIGKLLREIYKKEEEIEEKAKKTPRFEEYAVENENGSISLVEVKEHWKDGKRVIVSCL